MTHGTILWSKEVVFFVGVASRYDDRGPPRRTPTEKTYTNWTIYEAIKHHQGLLAPALRLMPCFFSSAWKLLRNRPTWRAA